MLTRISGQQFVLNCDLIERVDGTSDTVVSLVDGKKYVVTESPEYIVSAVRRFRGEVLAMSHHLSTAGYDGTDEDDLDDQPLAEPISIAVASSLREV